RSSPDGRERGGGSCRFQTAALSVLRARKLFLRLKNKTRNTMKGTRHSAEMIIPQRVVNKATEICPANSDGSAEPVSFSSPNAPAIPITVPASPTSGGSTTPSPKTKAALPTNFLERRRAAASDSASGADGAV